MHPLSSLKVFAAVLALAFLRLPASAQDVRQIARAVDEHYNRLRTMQAEFTEIYNGAGVVRTESGTLWLKKPGKMRWEYRSPREKLFLSDGKNVWFYVPEQLQVRKMVLKKLEDLRSPIAFLLGKANLQKELKGLSIASDQRPLEPGNTVLRGVPVGMGGRVEELLVEVTPSHQIARILAVEPDGATTEYRFSNQKDNVQVAESEFKFVVPPGVELIQGDLGGQ